MTGVVPSMTYDQARFCVERVNAHMQGAREELLRLYEAEGWRVLGYDSWRACAVTEFGQSQRHLYRQLEAAQIERRICPMGQIGTVPERQLRELAALPEEQQAAAYQRVVETAPEGRITTAHVAQTVEYFRPAPSPFRAAVAEAVERDGSYRENVLMEQYHAVAQRLLAAASTGRDLVRHVAPDEIAALLTEDDDKTFTYVADLLGWLQRAHEARRAGAQGIRRIK